MFEKLLNFFRINLGSEAKSQNEKNDLQFNEQNEKFLLDISTLRLGINDLSQNIKQSRDWLATLGLTISFIITIVTSDFKPIFGFTPEAVQMFFIVLTCIFGLLTLYALGKYFLLFSKTKDDSVIEYFRKNSKMPIEYRILCIIKNTRKNSSEKALLFFKDPMWDCFFLPHFKSTKTVDITSICEQLGAMLGVSAKDITAKLYDRTHDTTSEKMSKSKKCTTLYHSKFCYIQIGNPKNVMKNAEFVINKNNFKWQTVSEAYCDAKQMECNSDILRHLDDYSNDFIIQPADSMNFLDRERLV